MNFGVELVLVHTYTLFTYMKYCLKVNTFKHGDVAKS